MQSACNSLLPLRWARIRKILILQLLDLENTLARGDKFYKTLNELDFLGVEDVTHRLRSCESEAPIKF